MKIAFIISILLFFNTASAQNEKAISDDEASSQFYKNLDQSLKENSIENIENSKDKIVRIWRGQEIFIISDSSTYIKRFRNLKTDELYLYKQKLDVIPDTLSIDFVRTLEVKYYIDCFPTAIEMTDNNQYFLKVIGCNTIINSFTKDIYNDEIIENIEKFIKTLPSGEYQNGMTTFSINQPVLNENEQSDFYKKIMDRLSDNKILTTNPVDQPLVIIDNQQAYFEDLNMLKESNVKSIKILNLNQKIIYGKKGQHGVLIIKTK